MTVSSRLPVLIDYLVNLFTNDSTLGQASSPVAVYDGPVTTAAPAQLVLWVGLTDPDNDAAEPAGESQQEWAAIGRRGRNETVTIHCVAEAWSGAEDVRTVRVAAYGIVSAVETLMQADTTSFGGNVLFPDPGISVMQLSQITTERGPIARVQFDLVFKSRIGG